MKWSLAVAVVLGISGWIAHPYANDWRLRTFGCGGVLDAGDVAELAPDDARVESVESTSNTGLGTYACLVDYEGEGSGGGPGRLQVTAWTRPDDRDGVLRTSVDAFGSAPAAAPGGLPGFLAYDELVVLQQDCPDLPRAEDGGPAQMVAEVRLPSGTTGIAGASNRSVVALVNKASSELGCGAELLKADPHVVAPGKAVTGDGEAGGASSNRGCAPDVKASLKRSGDWVARGGAHAGPVTVCRLNGPGEAAMTLVGYFGNWADTVDSLDNSNEDMRALARCQGRPAVFAGSASEVVAAPERRAAFETYVEQQAAHRHCTDVNLKVSEDAVFR